MGLKEKMAEMWMGNMEPKEKQEMMDYFLTRLSQQGKISLKAETSTDK